MARYTKIPETNLAGTMGTVLGKTAGGICATVGATLTDLERKVGDLCANLDKETPSSLESKLRPIEAKLNSAENTLKKVEASIPPVKTLAKTIKVPINELKASIKVIKMIPIPQMWLAVSITTVYSDLLEMLSELVAQAEETSDGLLSVASTAEAVTEPERNRINLLREQIELLRARLSVVSVQDTASESDRDLLTNTGFFDSNGKCILDILLNGTKVSGMLMGNYGDSNVDLSNAEFQNRVLLGQSDISLETGSGDWIQTVYKVSTEEPSTPRDRKLVPEGWTEKEPQGVSWTTSTTVSGISGEVGVWAKPKQHFFTGQSSTKLETVERGTTNAVLDQSIKEGSGNLEKKDQSKIVRVLVPQDILNLTATEKNTLKGVFKISEREVSDFLGKLMKKLDKVPFSLDMQKLLQGLMTMQIESEKGELSENPGSIFWTAPNGELYEFVLKEDPDSPKIAKRRYVSVRDTSGSVILEGEKSFTLKYEVLIEEMKLRVIQLIG